MQMPYQYSPKERPREEVESYANFEINKVRIWARRNKMLFNENKSKLMIITRSRRKTKRDYKIYLKNKQMGQENIIKYLGIIIERGFTFNAHIDYTTGKCISLTHALSKSAKFNWGLRHDLLRKTYSGTILIYLINYSMVQSPS